ncbi:MAG: TusE/DsrC/DsvC family sulfur relay protein [Alphaproteobacteria bacterium]|nr:TusE/DsrC/DsvC family sulfur relay protein [Alphaproteobacteria bacterium]
MLRASRDEDVQRGLAVVVEVVRRVGEATARLQTPHPAPRRVASKPTPGHVVRRPVAAPAAPAATPSPAPVAAPPAGGGVAYDAQGFLVDRSAWTPELAEQLAASVGITLTEDHWRILRWIREEVDRSGASPNVRRIALGADVPIRTLYELFPKGPGKTAARLAGVPKPAGCI